MECELCYRGKDECTCWCPECGLKVSDCFCEGIKELKKNKYDIKIRMITAKGTVMILITKPAADNNRIEIFYRKEKRRRAKISKVLVNDLQNETIKELTKINSEEYFYILKAMRDLDLFPLILR